MKLSEQQAQKLAATIRRDASQAVTVALRLNQRTQSWRIVLTLRLQGLGPLQREVESWAQWREMKIVWDGLEAMEREEFPVASFRRALR